MANAIKNQEEILEKLGIPALNPMQQEAFETIEKWNNVVVLSPTGSGKTLSFLLPLLDKLNPEIDAVQALILVPSRELAIQIEQVVRNMGTGFKANAVYGGRAIAKDKQDLKHAPALLIGTPGRIADHFRQERLDTHYIETLVLDEFDKSLEVGFEKEMKEIIYLLPNLKNRILTSATQGVDVPDFVGLKAPKTVNFLTEKKPNLTIATVTTNTPDKFDELLLLLEHLGNKPGIIFCNLKDTLQKVSDFLAKRTKLNFECFHGGMEQRERERALIKFRNGTAQLLLATDLAARGIDIPELKFIIHYQLPYSEEEFIHRNGRTARVDREGTAYILLYEKAKVPEFIKDAEEADINERSKPVKSYWETLFISGGRKDKISKGDIAGLFFKQGNLTKEQLGVIELKQDCAFVAVPKTMAHKLCSDLNNSRLKKRKVRIYIA
ncbi:Superfamily II DNA and RNA helicase [Pustulibacterium marinum]|uniref:Superfamily II DNA and RNA helicase n=1 Tax=Pustulibacterium marinum TaxID=1224947 RepID=A0A1I7GC01_9FLAO|nr:DEAD/DEAH box helicase [Pustulibacterium marinum]SFU45955.1 Superfamily II DNA and RNA helicase [Pustulibacterium marinum]